MPFTPVTYNTGAAPGLDGPAFNAMQTQFIESLLSLNPDLFTPFVLTGLTATKDGTIANKLNLAGGKAYPLQSDQNEPRQRIITAQSFTTSTPSTTYFLDLNPDGTLSWGTSHSGTANYLPICSVTTDGSGNINVVTDARTLVTTLLSGAAAPPNLPANATAGNSKIWTQANDGSGSGLDADLLDGHDSSFFLQASTYTASDVLTKIKTVDGSGSGLDADTLDGHDASYFAVAGSTASDINGDVTASDDGTNAHVLPVTSNRGLRLSYKDSGGVEHAAMTFQANGATTLNATGAFKASGGQTFRVSSFFSGTGAGTFTHGLGITPSWVGITTTQANSTETVGVDTIGSSTVQVNQGASGWPWIGVATV